ncbi:ZIP family metal transporter [Noviherbaspirillum aridicola]|uniref:ZIP family metal transporter n=1 Tax=Noviherbaspirillum aridicola TaxID=2849687 RepID=A0ABQ4Q6K9_9BURK|nr:ZIP family metal transporter [Noviherbaspirillum aridicola]GIZ52768.1 ZIP family metal transporter [Noviherbaspirillum aridicola]
MDDQLAQGKFSTIGTAEEISWQRWLLAAAGFAMLVFLLLATLRFLRGVDARAGWAFQAGCLTALSTLLGTLPVLFARGFSQRLQDALLGFGAGVMLAASSFSLILPGIEAAEAREMNAWQAGGIVGLGILAGGALLFLFDRLLPHEHFIKGQEGWHARRLRRAWLFVGAIALHNLPEGLAIGVAFGGPNLVSAHALATGIGLQNIPEGLVVALSLRGVGYSRLASAALGAASGLLEPAGAAFGAMVIGMSAVLLPWGLAFAAGAMIYVISHEVIPESHRRGHEPSATWGLMLGFVLMMLLDTALA